MSASPDPGVLVIGGGPAGAACAIALADLGHAVTLYEAAAFPRRHVGISLSAGVARQLDFLGLARLLDHPAHLGRLPIERRWANAAFEPSAQQQGFICDRAQFDLDLLAAARARGVQVLQAVRAGRPTRTPGGWVTPVAGAQGLETVTARFVVDATGRGSPFRRRRRLGAPTLAVSSLWLGADRQGLRISAGPECWSWSAPIGPEARMVVTFADPEQNRRLGGSLESRHRALIAQSGLAETGVLQTGSLTAYEATPYVTLGTPKDLLRIGDADAALDPISSSGVQAAIQSALAAAPVVNTLLAADGDHSAARRFWRTRRLRGAAQHRTWAAALYAESLARHGTGFWALRAGEPEPRPALEPAPLPAPRLPLRLSPETRFVAEPCIVGARIATSACVSHPTLGEPVAFLGGQPLASLLRKVRNGATAQEVVAAWSADATAQSSLELLAWLWRRRVLVAA